ncbi:tripartite tricarboxylate transporter substrate binding protein [Bacillus canaveralius]|uniref:Tripartite tricarboxylate transporter substrate binding protein n=2 Tax=Bacillus canaveralius TaxID=1403243 RepID=A0A2N5GFM9_9BACI|nr:tripartite tricarboxylate transporter substrate binding protein [Bacillus canaveralius]PLR89068.1 tripartite tricarboxylate transporter substrate binding protein [Bacillus canaveralius]RSK49211.1 tripartite tricarboxylate transporter substrate binding protein [Bacillus canaveralius]
MEMQKRKGSYLTTMLIIIVLGLIVGGCGSGGSTTKSASANDTKSSSATKYPEKNIELVVGYKPGGGFNEWAQAIAPFIEKHLPNKVNVTVRNMPGAGGVIATNHIQKAKPDGYTIGLYDVNGLAPTQLARPDSFDLRKVTWLGTVAVDNNVGSVQATGDNTAENIMKQEKPKYIVSTRGLASNDSIVGAITLTKMGVNWEPLNHEATSEAVLSVIRGDADILFGSYESQQKYIDSGDLKPAIWFGTERNPKFPDVPIPSELGMPEFNEIFDTYKMIGAPPNMPEDVSSILEEAIKKSVEDPEFQEVLKKMKRTSSYLDAKATDARVEKLLKDYSNYTDTVKELFDKGE